MIETYYELVDMINNSEIKSEIKKSLASIYEDKELIAKIDEYHNTYNETIRKKIYNDEKYKQYKMLENRLNFLILSCNKYLGEIKDENNVNENPLDILAKKDNDFEVNDSDEVKKRCRKLFGRACYRSCNNSTCIF